MKAQLTLALLALTVATAFAAKPARADHFR